MSAGVQACILRLHAAGFSLESISRTVSLPVLDIRKVI